MTDDTVPEKNGRAAARLTLAIMAGVWITATTGMEVKAAEPAAFRDCSVCPEMIPLPAGTVALGDARVRDAAPPPDDPVRKVGPFAIARTETTFRQWGACVAEGACRGGQDDHGWGRDDRPVINVTAADARAYADWLSRRTGHSYRLPTEAEWEYAARAGTTTLYPWGDVMEQGRANCRGCDGPVVEHAGTTPVGTYPPNAFGLYDMNGNLWELTADCWTPGHAAPASASSDECKGACHAGRRLVLHAGTGGVGSARAQRGGRLELRGRFPGGA